MISPPSILMEDIEKKYIRWSEHCVWQSFGDTLAVVGTLKPDPGLIPTEERGIGVRLNSLGRDIWELCDGSRTFNDMYEQLLEEYEGDPQKIKEDLQKSIQQLNQKGFLTYEDAPRPYERIEVAPDKYPYWDDNVLWNEVEGQVVAMNNETGVSFEFPKELGRLWKLCDGSKTVDDILDTLEKEGIIMEQRPPSMIKLLLKQLLKLGMVVMRDEPVT